MHFSQTFLALLTAVSTASALGINCRGSALCTTDKKGSIQTLLGYLRAGDPNESFSDGQQVACQENQICVFYQKTGRTWTRAQTRDFVQGLIDHGCDACGSIPVDEGNNVDNGELTINYASSLQGRSALDGTSPARRAPDTNVETKRSNPPAIRAARNMTPRDTPKMQLVKRLGINCRGSGVCAAAVGGLPVASLSGLRDQISNGPDGVWYNGEHIGCQSHQSGRVCAFYQNVGDRSFDKGQTVDFLNRLLDHGCGNCGSIPTDDGNNVDNGELTVNYVL